jgi:hypothetical protein
LCFWFSGVGCLPFLSAGSGNVRNGLLNEAVSRNSFLTNLTLSKLGLIIYKHRIFRLNATVGNN